MTLNSLADFNGKFNVAGRNRESFMDFLASLGIDKNSVSLDSSVTLATEGAALTDCSGERIICPFDMSRLSRGSSFNRLITYAVNEDKADIVGKNIRMLCDRISFELLTDSIIQRIYICGSDARQVSFTLALAGLLRMNDISLRNFSGMILSAQGLAV